MTRFRLLGPFEVAADVGDASALPGKARALLARLLLEPGNVVAGETLIEDLWGEQPPRSARKLLQGYVSQIRKALRPGSVETRAPGYLARVSREDVDLALFERLTEAARAAREPSERVRLLREALALWRGPALVEFRKEPFALAAGRRLAELHQTAVEDRLEAALELEDPASLVGELTMLVDREPLRERPLRLLMLALYRSGRQADALALFRERRRAFVGELGIEPGPALQELERAILRQEPWLVDRPAAGRPTRGCVVCLGTAVADLLLPLARDGRELVFVRIVDAPDALTAASASLRELRNRHTRAGASVRTACFTSSSRAEDLRRLAIEQRAELLVLAEPDAPQIDDCPCDLAVAPRPDLRFEPTQPVLVPFGGGREEWAALELGAWLARAHGLPIRLLGTEAHAGRRDASQMLANASLALQRFTATAAEPLLVPAGAGGILEQAGSLLVASLPGGELDRTRRALVERSNVPVLLVRPGLTPGGLAPDRTLTRFRWSLADSAATA